MLALTRLPHAIYSQENQDKEHVKKSVVQNHQRKIKLYFHEGKTDTSIKNLLVFGQKMKTYIKSTAG